jgi:hypothetical protein
MIDSINVKAQPLFSSHTPPPPTTYYVRRRWSDDVVSSMTIINTTDGSCKKYIQTNKQTNMRFA